MGGYFMTRAMTRRRCLATIAAISALSLAGAGTAFAQSFPVKGKPITIIVPYGAGGVTDTAARMMAAALEKELETPVQVVNKVGAASQVGLTELMRSAPDGYTLGYAVLPTIVTHYLDPTRGAVYTRKDFQPVGMHHYTPQTLSVKADSPYKTVKDLVEAAKAKPGSIRISDSGLLAVPHSSVLMLEYVTGAKFASVHFNGGAPSVTALLGGHVEAMAGGVADALPHKQSGTFRTLGVASDKPDPLMPDVTTMQSQGYDVLAASATGILAPAKTSKEVVDTLTAAMKKVIDSSEHQKKLNDFGIHPYYLAPDAYTKFWEDTEVRMKPVMETLRPN
jgi:tripartite-type tricarboxylate transporter receptor subunit TctC